MRQLNHLEDLDKRGIHSAMAQAMRTSTLERFKQGRGPDGKKWPVSKRALAEGGKTLIDTARLKNSIRTKSDVTGFAVGTNVIYASTHQQGVKGRTIRAKTGRGLRFKVDGRWVTAKKVRIKIAPRPFLGISEEDMHELKGTMEDALLPS